MKYTTTKLAKAISWSLLSLPLMISTHANAADDGKNTYKFGGFVKTTASFSKYSDGEIGSGSIGRDFYIPGLIPVAVGGVGQSQDFDFNAKESRINFKSTHKLDNGITAKTYIEMDFLASPGGNERVSNSYNPRLRHAFIGYGDWLMGQTWSTFQDVKALPEAVDFLGAADGIIFERQPMVRYTKGGFQIAAENPESTITPNGGGARVVSDDNAAPDLVARYNHKGDWGHVSIAGLARQLSVDSGGTTESTGAGGVSLTGKIKVGAKNDIRFNLASGSGLGRYAALNTANGAVVKADGSLEAIGSTLGAVSYRHHWNPKWRSNLIVSGINVDNDTTLTGTGVTKSVNSVQVNLLTNPSPNLTLGVGYLAAERELESGEKGDMDRLMFTAKYGF